MYAGLDFLKITFANIISAVIRQWFTVATTLASAHWHLFDSLMPYLTSFEVTVLVSFITGFLMAIASCVWNLMHTNKVIAKALDEAAQSASGAQGSLP